MNRARFPSVRLVASHNRCPERIARKSRQLQIIIDRPQHTVNRLPARQNSTFIACGCIPDLEGNRFALLRQAYGQRNHTIRGNLGASPHLCSYVCRHLISLDSLNAVNLDRSDNRHRIAWIKNRIREHLLHKCRRWSNRHRFEGYFAAQNSSQPNGTRLGNRCRT